MPKPSLESQIHRHKGSRNVDAMRVKLTSSHVNDPVAAPSQDVGLPLELGDGMTAVCGNYLQLHQD